MSIDSSEALNTARRLCRTLDSTPDPLRQAQAIAAGLLKAQDWTSPARAQVAAFAEWLKARPPPSALKSRCKALLAALEAAR